MDECVDRQVDRRVVGGWLDRLKVGWMDGWVGGWLDGWMRG